MEKISLNYRPLFPDLAPWLTLSGSNYLCLEQILMVPKMFEPLKFDFKTIFITKRNSFFFFFFFFFFFCLFFVFCCCLFVCFVFLFLSFVFMFNHLSNYLFFLSVNIRTHTYLPIPVCNSRPRWLSLMCVRLVIRRSQVRRPPGRQHYFVDINHLIFFTVIISLPLI